MLTTDIALKEDPAYRKITQRFLDNEEEFELAFAKAWFKLTHRDMGPRARYIGKSTPKKSLIWQDPISNSTRSTVTKDEIANFKNQIRKIWIICRRVS